MKKLVHGIAEFRRKALPGYREKFARLALGQAPDALFIACSDSRVVPNLFASTDPGDLFVVRNVGNLIPRCEDEGGPSSDTSEGAAIEFALSTLNVSDIVVCGHSECGAMQALLHGRDAVRAPHLRSWLQHGEGSLHRLPRQGRELTEVNQLSQANVLQQIEHLQSYPIIRERVAAKRVRLHGWWFELSTADVYAYEPGTDSFVLIDEDEAERIAMRGI